MSIYQSSLLFILTASCALGGFKVPSSAFTSNQLDEAAAKAKEEGKGLAIVYTDAGST